MKVLKLNAHEKPINQIKFNFDGDLLFSASSDKKTNLWNSYTGERLGNYTSKGAVFAIDVTDDSKYLISGTLDGAVEVFEVMGGRNLGCLRSKRKSKRVEFSYGNAKISILFEAFSGGAQEIKIFDFKKFLATLEPGVELPEEKFECLHTIPTKDITQVSWGKLNKSLYCSTETGYMKEIDFEGKVLNEQQIHDSPIKCFTISKDYSLILTASHGGGGKLLDPSTLQPLRTFKMDVPTNACAISPLMSKQQTPKYHVLLAGGVSARIAAQTKESGFELHVWNAMLEKEIGTIQGHFSTVNTIAYHQDGRGFVSAGEEGIVRLYRIKDDYFNSEVLD